MNIEHIKNFLVLCEHLNYRIAAEQVFIAQPALTRQIQVLEEYLGVILFDRTNKKISLTKAGLSFRKECTRWLAQFDHIVDQTKEIHKGGLGNIIIGHSNSALNAVLPKIITNVKKKFPGIKLILKEMDNKSVLDSLEKHEIDYGICPNIIHRDNIESQVLYRENFVLLLPSNHPLAKQKNIDLSSLKNEHFILPSIEISSGYVESIHRILQDFGYIPNIAYESVHSSSVVKMVELGLGVSIEPLSAIGHFQADIVIKELKNINQKVELKLLYLKDRKNDIIDFMQLL
jgi:DNA-binding transcriptional LysR family regulator